jgi:serine phosphatase RsbU (regulator of sigma subunit)
MEVWGGNQAVEKSFLMPGLNVWLTSRPYQAARGGGDVYYISSCASGRITRLLLADVSGHGAAVSNVAIGLRDLMRRNVNLMNQRKFVSEMNRQFADRSEDSAFATALTCSYFAPTRKLSLCNAGHPPPLLYESAARSWRFIEQQSNSQKKISNTPLGIFEEAAYVQFEITLNVGDMVLIYSDAFIEAVDSSGEQLGMEGMAKIVNQLDISSPEQIVPNIAKAIRDCAEENLSDDDATMMLVRCDGTGSTIINNLLAPLRLLRKATDAVKLSSDQ